MNRRAAIGALIGLGGCASPVKYNTASGRPERSFAGPPDQVRAMLVSELVNRGYQITRETQSLVEGQKHSTNFAANVLLSTRYDPTVMVRASYTIIAVGDQTRVVGDLALVSNPGSAFERVTPMSNSEASLEMQAHLNRMAL